MAQQLAPDFEEACAPHQYALSTRAGPECVARAIRVACELDPRATLVSFDGVRAYDHVSRRNMLAGMRHRPRLAAALLFVRLFYGQASRYVWYDDEGQSHFIEQDEGGEQGDPLMPGLFALGQHLALEAAQAQLLPEEALFAHLDDFYVVCAPQRARQVFDLVRLALREHAHT